MIDQLADVECRRIAVEPAEAEVFLEQMHAAHGVALDHRHVANRGRRVVGALARDLREPGDARDEVAGFVRYARAELAERGELVKALEQLWIDRDVGHGTS